MSLKFNANSVKNLPATCHKRKRVNNMKEDGWNYRTKMINTSYLAVKYTMISRQRQAHFCYYSSLLCSWTLRYELEMNATHLSRTIIFKKIYHHCPSLVPQPCYHVQQPEYQPDRRIWKEINSTNSKEHLNWQDKAQGGTCGGLMIAQKLSTGYIPRFEMLHKHRQVRISNMEYNQWDSNTDQCQTCTSHLPERPSLKFIRSKLPSSCLLG
jgi:hypothetical protein